MVLKTLRALAFSKGTTRVDIKGGQGKNHGDFLQRHRRQRSKTNPKKDWRLTWDELQFIWVSSFPPQLLSIVYLIKILIIYIYIQNSAELKEDRQDRQILNSSRNPSAEEHGGRVALFGRDLASVPVSGRF